LHASENRYGPGDGTLKQRRIVGCGLSVSAYLRRKPDRDLQGVREFVNDLPPDGRLVSDKRLIAEHV
jgi:hypothetical protein